MCETRGDGVRGLEEVVAGASDDVRELSTQPVSARVYRDL